MSLSGGAVVNGQLAGAVTSAGGIIDAIGGAASLTTTGGTTMVLGANTYTGPTILNGGALVVNGSAVNSAITVNSGALLTGAGTVGATTIANGGAFAPGPLGTIGSMTVAGNLAFESGALYLVQVAPANASSAMVTASHATLGGTVLATFAPGSYITKQYTILSAADLNGAFGGLTTNNLPVGFAASLSYGANDVFLNLTATLGLQQLSGGGLPGNAQNVANAINGYFNNGGALPINFLPLFGLAGNNLASALTQLSGEAATGAQQGAFRLTNLFLTLMLDPLVYGGGFGGGNPFGFGLGGPALRLAADDTQSSEVALAFAKILKAPSEPLAALVPEARWNVWAGGYGGANSIKGDPLGIGSHDVSASAGGYAGGVDYRIWPGTTVGLALAGGFTNWGLANGLGGGNSDAFQAGLYGATRSGPAYLAGALSFAEHWMATDRTAFGDDRLTARFNAQNYAGRIEGGWRFATFLGGVAPYAAVQTQTLYTPAFSETDQTVGGFGQNFNARSANDTRGEFGARFDKAVLLADMALLTLNARTAWAHDWVSDPALTAVFQTLPGASFIVNGAALAPNSALLSLGSELRFLNGWGIGIHFDGEFAENAQSYAGTGTVRYAW